MLFCAFGVWIIIVFIINLSLRKHAYNKNNYRLMNFVFVWSVIWIICSIMVVIVSFNYSYKIFYSTVASVDSKINPRMLCLIITFQVLFIISYIMYYFIFRNGNLNYLVFVDTIYELSRLCQEIAIFYLARLFGVNIEVKSTVQTTGDLIVTGFNEKG
jgi:hypothetical protein